VAWLVDGSNVLGAMRVDLHAAEPKRELARRLPSFARARRTRVTCYFDGDAPESFARHFGSATVIFSGRRAADDLIAGACAEGRGWQVVTSDRGLAARVASRRVTLVESRAFLAELERLDRSDEGGASGDWEEWFADPKNRDVF
jgi:hypothetical protein